MLLFHYGNRLMGVKQDRLSFVGARANAKFSMPPFTMPTSDLLLNAAAPAPVRAFATQQAYILTSVLDEKGEILPGIEADKCLFKGTDQIDMPLIWEGRSANELAGQKISLRFYRRIGS